MPRPIRLPPGVHIEALQRLRNGWHPKRIVKPWDHIRIATTASREPKWADGGELMVAMCRDKRVWTFTKGRPDSLKPLFTAEEVDRFIRAYEVSRKSH